MKHIIIKSIILLLFIHVITNVCAQNSGYYISKTFHIASSGGWDYIAIEPTYNRLYVSHSTQVNILDKSTGDSIGVIQNTAGVHGIAFIQSINKGYTSNGRLNTVTVFDLKTNKVLSQIKTGENPDAIIFEKFSKKIITCNGRSNDLSIIDPETEKVIATIPVGGKPEAAVSDEIGKLYVNIEDKSEIVTVDMRKYAVIARWSISPGEEPTGLAIDLETRRLFSGCDKLLIVVNADNGKIVDKLLIGEGCDGVAFDASSKYIFASCGQDGVVSVIKEESANKYSVFENITTKKSARTIAIDNKTHEIYLPAADLEKSDEINGRPKMVSGTFQVIVLSNYK